MPLGRTKLGRRRQPEDAREQQPEQPDHELDSYLAALTPEEDEVETTGTGSRFGAGQVHQLRLPTMANEELRELAEHNGTSPAAMATEWVMQRLAWETQQLRQQQAPEERPSREQQRPPQPPGPEPQPQAEPPRQPDTQQVRRPQSHAPARPSGQPQQPRPAAPPQPQAAAPQQPQAPASQPAQYQWPEPHDGGDDFEWPQHDQQAGSVGEPDQPMQGAVHPAGGQAHGHPQYAQPPQPSGGPAPPAAPNGQPAHGPFPGGHPPGPAPGSAPGGMARPAEQDPYATQASYPRESHSQEPYAQYGDPYAQYTQAPYAPDPYAQYDADPYAQYAQQDPYAQYAPQRY